MTFSATRRRLDTMSTSTHSGHLPLLAIGGDDDDLSPLTSIVDQEIAIHAAEDIDTLDETGIYFITGETLKQLPAAEFAESVYESRSFLVVLPPFSDQVLTVDTTEDNIEVEARNRSTIVHPRQQLRQYLPLDKLRLVTRSTLDTSLGVVLAVDGSSTPVMTSYQPTNTDGGVIVTTVELATYELKSDETHRRDLVHGLLDYINDARVRKSDTTTDENENEAVVLSDTLINNALLALHTLHESETDKQQLEPTVLRQQLPPRFTFKPSSEEWNTLKEYLHNESVLTDNGIREEVLAEKITSRRLDPYARRING